jgi:glycosyltransferase involved in cell wall biosynthesis
LTSKYEGLPTVLIEAMSNALPVVTTDFPDAHNIVDNGTTGYIISQNNLRGLIECIKALTSFSNMAERMGQAGYKKVHKQYGKDIIDIVVEGWSSVLKKRTGCPDSNDHVDYCKWCNEK